MTMANRRGFALLEVDRVREIARMGGGLLGLKFSRNDETEADLIGIELAARAGYDPRAGITLWQKMAAASKGAPPEWLSTHPASAARAPPCASSATAPPAISNRLLRMSTVSEGWPLATREVRQAS